MSSLNRVTRPTRTGGLTHEGGPAAEITPFQRLRRSVNACLLWEDGFYEDGQTNADRIKELIPQVPVHEVLNMAVKARTELNLRHVPLLLARELARHPRSRGVVAGLLPRIIQRADELAEFLSIYWLEGKSPLARSVKIGLAEAFTKFDAYQLAKYNGDKAIKLRDVMFLVHPKAKSEEQQAVFDKLAAGTLESPDTWEVALSGGANKRETFERLIREGNLGYFATLRNLRNMNDAGVDGDLVRQAIANRSNGFNRILPFRFIAAAKHAPRYFTELDSAFKDAVANLDRFEGETVVLVDVSGSMDAQLSAKSDMTRMDAACALASMFPGRKRVFSFSYKTVECPAIEGLAGVDTIRNSQSHGGTNLGAAIEYVNTTVPHDRLIVITDEQSADRVPSPVAERAYMINVASYRNGVGYKTWTHIDGFSESIFRYIQAEENLG